MILGISGLVDVKGYLTKLFPARMATPNLIQGMDAAAAIVHDGKVIAAASQERFDRIKKSSAFPFDAIDYCLDAAGIKYHELEAVCSNFDFARYQFGSTAVEIDMRKYFLHCLSPSAFEKKLFDRYHTKVPFHPISHHISHLHSALVSYDQDDCLSVIVDAAGEIVSTTVFTNNAASSGIHLKEYGVRRIKQYPIQNSLGVIYSLITQFLGFAPNEDEYKVMGLASFGDPARYAEFFESRIQFANGNITIPCLLENKGFAEGLFFSGTARRLAHDLGFDGRDAPFQQRADLSAALQKRFTEALMHICLYHAREHFIPPNNLLLSGGCAENCNAVGAIRDLGWFQRVYVAYASSDEGTALGAAAAYSFAHGKPVRHPNGMPFFGPAPQSDKTQKLAAQHGLRFHSFVNEDSMLNAAAIDIASDKIVALCHGRMEYGARALGDRSLLALPSNADNQNRINIAIKKRENYRPFAPAVIIEDAHKYFELEPNEAYPYMTMLTRVRKDANLPAITHVDGTARVQTVDQQHNPAFYSLLTHLKDLNGVPVVLNTSYNVNHQPIVCTEEEAIQTFIEMEIDALYMANTRITR